MNAVVVGDCLDVLPEITEKAALIYVDPPFFTQQKWTGKAGSFDDRFEDLPSYIDFMYQRLLAMRHSLVPNGVLAVHCDDHASNELAMALDGIFEVAHPFAKVRWKRSSGANASRKFGRSSDTILFYVAGPKPRSVSSGAEDEWTFLSKGGWENLDLDEAELGRRVSRALWNVQEADDFEIERDISASAEPRTFNPQPGEYASSDLWLDIPNVGSSSRERTGYPTQKPEALLERVILTLTDPGDLVIDPMCGSGTTLAVARRLDRRAFGCDISPDAVALSTSRLSVPLPTSLFDEVAS